MKLTSACCRIGFSAALQTNRKCGRYATYREMKMYKMFIPMFVLLLVGCSNKAVYDNVLILPRFLGHSVKPHAAARMPRARGTPGASAGASDLAPVSRTLS
jgi:hypothetical protein